MADGVPGSTRDPTHQDGEQPTVDEPADLDRERWDALVFDTYDHGYFYVSQTIVLDRATVPTIRICIQSSDTSRTGERLAAYSDASWWREQIQRWTGIGWNGEIRIAACTEEPPEGWIYLREGRPGEVWSGHVAHAATERENHWHHSGRWLWSELVWNPDRLDEMDDERFEMVVAHELGHALGFSHVPRDSGYIMVSGSGSTWSEEESSLAQLAYRVGPNVRYPGLVRSGPRVEPGRPVPDRAALVALYRDTGGSSWTDSTNWDSDRPIGHWRGVTADSDGRVTRLDLHENNLKGQMPPDLGSLTHIEALSLGGNELTGPIPRELGALGRLTYLSFRSNNLTGHIPPELGGMASLSQMFLSYNELSGRIPPEIGNLVNLTYVEIRNTKLTGPLPSSMTNLRRLRQLNIVDNDGLCAPADAEFQRWLAGINFDGDVCEGEELDSVPAELRATREALIALYDAAGGANWRERANWGTDKPLDEWYGVRTDALGRVYFLNLASNNLSGTIPRALGDITSLTVLRLASNEGLAGPLPRELGKLANLEILGLSGASLTGSIPREIGGLSKLRRLDLRRNKLTGSIPRELGGLTRLEELTLENNDLSGPAPPELADLTNLERLFLHRNNLTGPLPLEFVNLTKLEHLSISSNAGLCAPTDAAFQAWLETLLDFDGEMCGEVVVSGLPLIGQLMLALLLLSGGARLYRRR